MLLCETGGNGAATSRDSWLHLAKEGDREASQGSLSNYRSRFKPSPTLYMPHAKGLRSHRKLSKRRLAVPKPRCLSPIRRQKVRLPDSGTSSAMAVHVLLCPQSLPLPQFLNLAVHPVDTAKTIEIESPSFRALHVVSQLNTRKRNPVSIHSARLPPSPLCQRCPVHPSQGSRLFSHSSCREVRRTARRVPLSRPSVVTVPACLQGMDVCIR